MSSVAIVLMVKNEALSVESMLFSFVKAGIRHFFIFDTGSSDNTVAIAKTFFKNQSLEAYIEQEPFVDFSTSRNRALELAEKHFELIPFLLMPDAEWQAHDIEALICFCEEERENDTPLYLVKMKMNAMEFFSARLFRTASRIRFQGLVHEAPSVIASVQVPDYFYFEVKASAEGIKKTHSRWQQDLQLLSKAYADNPKDPRNTFYLAQTYECLNNLEEAYQIYQYRAELNGWDEENFMTFLRLGNLAKQLYPNDWPLAMNYFLKAFSLRPHRIEPLLKIADYYWPHNIPTGYLFLCYAYEIPYPEKDLLFVDKEAYDYTRYEMMSRSAWYMGQYALGEEATEIALKVHPHTEHLLKNLALYKQKLNSIEKEIV